MSSQNYSVRRENIEAVVNALTSSGRLSRSQISAATKISLMTIGKIADALCRAGAAVQKKSGPGSSGRRASYLELNSGKYITVITCAKTLSASLYDFSLARTGELDVGNTYRSSELAAFSGAVAFRLFSDGRLKQCACAAAIMGDVASEYAVRKAISAQLPADVSACVGMREAGALSACAGQAGRALYAYLGDAFYTCLTQDGRICGESDAAHFILPDNSVTGEKYRAALSGRETSGDLRLLREVISDAASSAYNCALAQSASALVVETGAAMAERRELVAAAFGDIARIDRSGMKIVYSAASGAEKYAAGAARLNWIYKNLEFR